MGNLFSIADFIEFMNLYLVLLDLCFIAVLVRFLMGEGGRSGWRHTTAGVALGLVIYLTGHLWIRTWTWFNWYLRTGSAWQQDPTQVIMFTTGLVITTIGLVMLARKIMGAVGPRVWYISVLGSAFIAVAFTWIT